MGKVRRSVLSLYYFCAFKGRYNIAIIALAAVLLIIVKTIGQGLPMTVHFGRLRRITPLDLNRVHSLECTPRIISNNSNATFDRHHHS